jgi:DNA topoisomerase-1
MLSMLILKIQQDNCLRFGYKSLNNFFSMYEKKKKAYERSEEQLTKLEVQATDKDENKEIALGTSKLNYLDPRISVAWYVKSLFIYIIHV